MTSDVFEKVLVSTGDFHRFDENRWKIRTLVKPQLEVLHRSGVNRGILSWLRIPFVINFGPTSINEFSLFNNLLLCLFGMN